jgi:D-glycero-alpha-D-manno-heptose-7-phosphate kinase
VVAAVIDKYVYVAVNDQFEGRVMAHYRATEDVATAAELQHDRMRACLLSAGLVDAIEVTSMADVPGSTGLGSSSAFTVGLLHALRPGKVAATYAETACAIEIDDCRAPVGKQDQYTAAYGGLNVLRFHPNGRVDVQPIGCDTAALSRHLLLLYTGARRAWDAGTVLAAQAQPRDAVRALAGLTGDVAGALTAGDWQGCGRLMDAAWGIKQYFVKDERVSIWYRTAKRLGAWGGKLCGAGGGGFLCFLAPPETHAAIVTTTGLRAVPVQLGVSGSAVVYGAAS